MRAVILSERGPTRILQRGGGESKDLLLRPLISGGIRVAHIQRNRLSAMLQFRPCLELR